MPHPPGLTPADRERGPGRALHAAAAAVLLFALTVLLQMRAGAYGAAFDYDESSHVVSGLLIHDYLLHGLGRSPIGFLRQFHA